MTRAIIVGEEELKDYSVKRNVVLFSWNAHAVVLKQMVK